MILKPCNKITLTLEGEDTSNFLFLLKLTEISLISPNKEINKLILANLKKSNNILNMARELKDRLEKMGVE